jgi:hypothetical protein
MKRKKEKEEERIGCGLMTMDLYHFAINKPSSNAKSNKMFDEFDPLK